MIDHKDGCMCLTISCLFDITACLYVSLYDSIYVRTYMCVMYLRCSCFFFERFVGDLKLCSPLENPLPQIDFEEAVLWLCEVLTGDVRDCFQWINGILDQ